MGLSKSIEKLGTYFERLEAGKTRKIKPSHVQKVIDTLEQREKSLKDDIQAATKKSKQDRLRGKRKTVLEQLAKARWLLKEIS